MLSLNSQMLKLSKTRKVSNFQILSNSADFRKLVLHTQHSAPQPTIVKMSIFQEIIHFLKYATMTKHATSRIELHDVSDFIMLTFDRRHFGKNILLIYMYLILRILSEMNIS